MALFTKPFDADMVVDSSSEPNDDPNSSEHCLYSLGHDICARSSGLLEGR